MSESQKPTLEEIKESSSDFNISLSKENLCNLISIYGTLRIMQERTKGQGNFWEIRADALEVIIHSIIEQLPTAVNNG